MMNLEKIGIQGNLDACHLLYLMLNEDGEHWDKAYESMWPEQRKAAVLALCRIAKLDAVAQYDGVRQARDGVLAELKDFVAAHQSEMRFRVARRGLPPAVTTLGAGSPHVLHITGLLDQLTEPAPQPEAAPPSAITHYTAWLVNDRSALNQDCCDITVLQDELIGGDPDDEGAWASNGSPVFHAVTSVDATTGDINVAKAQADNNLTAAGWQPVGAWKAVPSAYTITVRKEADR